MIENLTLPTQTIINKTIQNLGINIKEVSVKPCTKAQPEILIGKDNLNLIDMRGIIQINKTDMMFS
jgi:hypothetical protein